MLEVRGLDAGYGLTAVLKNVSLAVPDRAVVALLGGNGAGKTTTLNTISGFLHPTAGTITLDGQSIAGLPSHEIVRRGVVQVPQGREVFPGLTVHENLELGAIVRRDVEVRADLEMVYALFPRLRDRRWQKAGSFSGGEQQMLAIGRGMMARPRVLLLDEPSMGLAPLLVEELGETIADLNRKGMTILLVEQNIGMALAIAAHAYILKNGAIAASGDASELAAHPEIVMFYLGA
jgi:branched-chain amino acid transport system ATP-binding protein